VSELPPTWAEVPLSAITVDSSQRVPLADEVIRYIDIGSVNRNTKSVESPQELLGKDAPSRARKQVAVGSWQLAILWCP
jgi:type I restriction enzyme S subunit